MSFRQDKLVLLLDTGTSSQVRRTAARQIAELALKTFRASLSDEREDVKAKQEGQDDDDTKVTLAASTDEQDAWSDVLETVSKIIPLLRSKSSETRHAAATALGLLADTLPAYPRTLPSSSSSSSSLDVASLLKTENMLLASAGREYVAKPSAGDKAKRRKAMMGSMGLGDAVGWGDDVDKVIGEEEDAMDVEKTETASVSTPPIEPPKDIFEGLSARQITMLKRKKGNIEEEANKLRKLNQQAAGGAPSSSTAASTQATPKSSPPPPPPPQSVTIDPGAKARAAAAQGGAVEPVLDAEGNAITKPTESLTFTTGESPWVTVLRDISLDLTEPAWQTRHGAALATMEISRYAGSSLPSPFLLNLARRLLSVLVLDRFGDFVGDTVAAPVRETAAQAVGVLLKFLDTDNVVEVHSTFVQMVKQPWAKRGKAASDAVKGEKFSWEVRHAGLLGLKYEVAVRKDLLAQPVVLVKTDTKPDVSAPTFLEDVVDNAITAMLDVDDDVRTEAGLSLVPVAADLPSQLTQDRLTNLVDTLWDCLAKDSDDLGSSAGAIMDLLRALVDHPTVRQIIGTHREGRSPDGTIHRVLTFFRHPVPSVRLATAHILHNLATAEGFDRSGWMFDFVFSHLFQNIILEERAEIRDLDLLSFEAGLLEAQRSSGICLVTVADVLEWYKTLMSPIGSGIDVSLLKLVLEKKWAHNVDKAMIAGDLSLITTESILATRISAAKALAIVREVALGTADKDMAGKDDGDEQGDEPKVVENGRRDLAELLRYVQSSNAHQILMASVVIQTWAENWQKKGNRTEAIWTADDETRKTAETLLKVITRPLPATYDEMTAILVRIQAECSALLRAFSTEAKVTDVPSIPSTVDASSQTADNFTIATAQAVVGPTFDTLISKLSKSATQKIAPSLRDRQRKIMASIGHFGVMKERLDVQSAAAVAGALVALQVAPEKFGPMVKSLMDGVKKEESEILQSRAAASVAGFVQFCNGPFFAGASNPSAKIVKNLFTFLCQDTSVTPVFVTSTEGIITLKEGKPVPTKKTAAGIKEEAEETEEQRSARITRRGATEAFRALSQRFGDKLFESVPKFWEGLSAALVEAFHPGTTIEAVDEQLKSNAGTGQAVVDCLTSIGELASEIHPSLQPRLIELLPSVIMALSSSYAIVRSSAAKCLAALCSVIPEEGMRRVVDDVVPMIGDAKRTASRQGAVEAIHHIIKSLDIRILPYVLFLIVPILGRMSDPDEPTRLLSTRTFALLVRMVPLEAGLPDPPGFSAEMLAKRDEERAFLTQLLDGRKAEPYHIPIPIKAELRQYQRDGVSWLAFLAKYQLHGVLCDDMGLGKSLQSICIVGSKHFERAAKHKQSASVDSAHLPSLIVCPPTLIGHWYYEILKFTDHLRSLQYTGSAIERAGLLSQLRSPDIDVVITSYEIVRSDIAELSKVDWLYCVLDEGHIIKNAKTKLSAAVKQLKAQHRLLLSGTPIQNNVLELWSLFDFLMPGFLGNERVFNDRFSKPILADREGKATPKEKEAAAAALEALHKQVLPFLLRRLKEDVLHDLPPKIIQDYYCELSASQTALYDEFSKSRAAEEIGEAVVEGGKPGQGHVFQSLGYLRKLCNHPALVLSGPEEKQRWAEVVAKIGGDVPPLHDISHAPKLLALKQLLTDCGIGVVPDKLGTTEEVAQHRVLVFCQSRVMLDLVERDLFAATMPQVRYMRMDGQTDPRKRHAIVQTFNADPRIDVLLLTTSVGGLGLNLTGADTVIFIDHDWNPMKDLQAMDRAHRLGQKKVVNVYRLITRGTLEEKIMGLQRFKLNIASSVVTQQNAGLGSMNTGEVLDLFKVSAEPGPTKAKQSNGSGPLSASAVLEGLEDLPPEDEYAELSLSNFMSKV